MPVYTLCTLTYTDLYTVWFLCKMHCMSLFIFKLKGYCLQLSSLTFLYEVGIGILTAMQVQSESARVSAWEECVWELRLWMWFCCCCWSRCCLLACSLARTHTHTCARTYAHRSASAARIPKNKKTQRRAHTCTRIHHIYNKQYVHMYV